MKVAATARQPVKVLYLAGLGRSGSTILDNILGQIPGYFSTGELRLAWDLPTASDRLCGCGEPVGSCPIWREVLEKVFGGDRGGAVAAGGGGMAGSKPRMLRYPDRPWHWPLIWMAGGGARAKALWRHPAELGKLYSAIQATTGCRVIVDSSKFPTYGAMLDQIRSIDVHVVHLVRDPRAVAFSWQRKRRQPSRDGTAYMRQYSAARTALRWLAWNWTVERYWRAREGRYLRLRYEDLIQDPRRELTRISAFMGEKDPVLPLVEEDTVRLSGNHTVWGNPSRFKTGLVQLRDDDEWRTAMSDADRTVIRRVTSPLLSRYGYGGDEGSAAQDLSAPVH